MPACQHASCAACDLACHHHGMTLAANLTAGLLNMPSSSDHLPSISDMNGFMLQVKATSYLYLWSPQGTR
jgi:hypothetical protein